MYTYIKTSCYIPEIYVYQQYLIKIYISLKLNKGLSRHLTEEEIKIAFYKLDPKYFLVIKEIQMTSISKYFTHVKFAKNFKFVNSQSGAMNTLTHSY